MNEQRVMNRRLAVVGTMMIIPSIGAVYAWSIYRQPLAEILAAHQGVTPESLTADFYGTRNYGGNYGIVYLAYGFGAPLGGWIGSAFPLNMAFNIAAGCALISFVLMLTTKQPEKKGVAAAK